MSIRTLIVDPSEQYQEILRHFFYFKKFPAVFEVVGTASSGDSAFEMIRRLIPDLVITRQMISGLSGLQLIMKCREEGYDCKFIINTSSDITPEFVEKALEVGASTVIPKGDTAALQAAIGKIFG